MKQLLLATALVELMAFTHFVFIWAKQYEPRQLDNIGCLPDSPVWLRNMAETRPDGNEC